MDIKVRDDSVLRIEGYQNIDEAIDDAFIALFTAFFLSYYQNPVTSLHLLIKDQYPIFENSVVDYLKQTQPVALYQDKLINNLTPIWTRLRDDGRLKDAQQFWKFVLSSVEKWEIIFSTRIHKGSIYYYWGGTAILDGELDKGFFLMHAAYQEDIQSLNTPNPNTPAYMFVSLDFEEEHQYFGGILDIHASFLDNFIQNYAKVRNTSFSKEIFQKQFLAKHVNRDSVFLFSYTLARLFHTARIPPQATNNSFASLLELNILFDLTLVIDSSIQAKSNVGWQFFNLALDLGKRANLDLSEQKLGEIKTSSQLPNGFATTLLLLLDKKFQCSDKSILGSFESDIAISYLVRNYGAHNVISQEVVWKRYGEILQSLLNTLFLVTEFLY